MTDPPHKTKICSQPPLLCLNTQIPAITKSSVPHYAVFAKHQLRASSYQTKMPNTSYCAVQSHFY